MTVPGLHEHPRNAYAMLRDRCRELGLPSWHCDSAGLVTEEPSEPGVAGILLRSKRLSEMIWEAVSSWISTAPDVHRLLDGCWLIPIVEHRGRRRSGLTVAMAVGRAMLDSDELRAICRSAQLDVHAARAALKKFAQFDENSARRLAASLQWMVKDLQELSEHRRAVEGFTVELTDAYETIDLLYGLGRSMHSVSAPDRFIATALDRLHEAMGFGWIAGAFTLEAHLDQTASDRLVVRGDAAAVGDPAGHSLDRLVGRAEAEGCAFIVFDADEAGFPIESPVLVQPVLREGKLCGILMGGDKRGDDPQISSYDMQLLEAAGAYLGAFLENSALYAEQQLMFLGSLKALTAAIDAKDRYTCGHSERVAHLAAELATLVGLGRATAERIRICGLVHDVGKIGVPEAVLCKPGRLTEAEFTLIKLHPEIGHRILRDIPLLEDVLPGVLHHHERWDGTGYPHGLAGEQIPLFARLLGIADTFDAMSSTRSYRSAMPREKVLAEIARCGGSQFDPAIVGAFLKVDLGAYDEMVARHAREQADGTLRAA